jgi:hypothetical protein
MREALDPIMRRLAKEAVDVPVLGQLASQNLAIDLWAGYLAERMRSIVPDGEGGPIFEALLMGSAELSGRAGFEPLALALGKNLDEEQGVYGGEVKPAEVHSLWRDRFAKRLKDVLVGHGASREQFQAPIQSGTEAYLQYLFYLKAQLEQGQLFEAAGALCVLEGIIRDEYALVARGLDVHFPEIEEADRRYIDDHARHDELHYRWLVAGLERALDASADPDEAYGQIVFGAEKMTTAKKAFFTGLSSKQSNKWEDVMLTPGRLLV